MAVKSYIFIVPANPIYNKEFVPVFDKMNQADSSLLYSAMYLNFKDMLSRLKEYNPVYCFDERDREFLPAEFCEENISKYFVRSNEVWKGMRKLIADKVHQESPNILLLFSNSITITPAIISRYFNFLNHDDYNLVVGRSDSEKIGAIGLNYYEDRLFEDFSSCDITYNNFLKHTGKLNSHLFTLNSILTVENFEHFRTLYKVLSRKESIEFCSHEIHELFTHLFIEYKEFL
ncbi:MAG: hypothetical protein ACM34K_03515 [Bacillota bacterium]